MMSLPKVTVQAVPGEAPVVTVDGSPIAGVRSAQVTVTADHLPQVSLVLSAAEVDVELPAAVTVLRAGASATQFADQLSTPRLEAEAAGTLDMPMGEAFAAAVRTQAAEFDAQHGV